MSEHDKAFSGNIPELYDTYLVPLIFQTYADDLAARIADLSPRSVLETAAGSGVVTRALAALLGPDADYVVTDLNQAMLDHATVRQGDDARVSWRQADALALPFDDQSFDAVACQFGVMFLPDKQAGYAEARRVLRPGGSLIFNVWDRIEHNEFAAVVTRALGTVFPDDPPLFLARKPHGYHDVGSIEADVRAAGFDQVAVETIERTSTADTAREPAIAYCQGTPLRNEIEARDATSLEQATDAAADAIAKQFGQGPVSGRIRGHVVTATA